MSRTRERDALNIVGLTAIVGAAWLGIRFARREGTRADRVVRRGALAAGTRPVRLAATVLSPPAFPLVYMPAALIAARALSQRGNSAGRRIPLAACLAFIAYHTLKRTTQRMRPPSNYGDSTYTHSYPSGHSTASAAVAVACALAMRHNAERTSPATLAMIGVGAPLLVGTSRVLLDKHWLSDVVGGWMLGAGIAGLTHRAPSAQRWSSNQNPPPKPIAATAYRTS